MKNGFSLLMAVILGLCLSGCKTNKNITTQNDDADIKIWTDTETGVQYVIYADCVGYCGQGGITPRLNADGTLYHDKGGDE